MMCPACLWITEMCIRDSISGDQSALELPADKTVVLKDFAQALEKQLPEGTVHDLSG